MGRRRAGPEAPLVRRWLTDHYADTDPAARVKDLQGQEIGAGSFPVSFDGQRWMRYVEVQADWIDDQLNDSEWHKEGIGSWRITTGPDGTAWANVTGGGGPGSLIYVISPKAVAAAE